MALSSTAFHGKVCRIRKNTTNINGTGSWQITANIDMADITAQGDSWKTQLPGIASWNGSFEMQFIPGNTEQKALLDNLIAASPGTKLTDVKFVQDAQANQFTGNIYLTSISVNAPLTDVVKMTVSFVGDGALTLTAEGT